MNLGLISFTIRNPHEKSTLLSRRNPGYEKIKAMDFANNIFLTGDLNRDYHASSNMENFDWDGLARKYHGKLTQEFIDQNILNARVQSLEKLSQRDDKYWADYMKFNIEFIEKYGTDHNRCF